MSAARQRVIDRIQEFVFHAVAFFLLAVYPFAKFVRHNEAQLFGKGSVILLAAFLAAALVAAAAGARWRPVVPATYAFLLLVQMAATGDKLPPVRLAGAFLVSLAAGILLHRAPRLRKPVVVIFLAGCLLTEAGIALGNRTTRASWKPEPPEAQAAGASFGLDDGDDERHILHLILDEHIGPDGMPGSVPASREARNRLVDFYTSRRFTLHAQAYSHYATSRDSIPSLMNDRPLARSGESFERGEGRDLRVNRIFDAYRASGHALSVYQSRYINFCAHPGVTSCFQYNENSIAALEGQPYGALESAWVIGSQYTATSALYHQWGKRILAPLLRVKVGPLSTAPDLFDRLRGDILAARGKTAFFAHVLMPHHPYVYDAQCRPRPVRSWLMHHQGPVRRSAPRNSPEGYRLRYERYYEQMACLDRLFGDLLDDLQDSGLLERMTVIVHGDHGSRIVLEKEPYAEFAETIAPEDVASSFSALAAVRLPEAEEGRLSTEPVSVARVIHAAARGRRGVDQQSEWEGSQDRPGQAGPHVYFKSRAGDRGLTPVPLKSF